MRQFGFMVSGIILMNDIFLRKFIEHGRNCAIKFLCLCFISSLLQPFDEGSSGL